MALAEASVGLPVGDTLDHAGVLAAVKDASRR